MCVTRTYQSTDTNEENRNALLIQIKAHTWTEAAVIQKGADAACSLNLANRSNEGGQEVDAQAYDQSIYLDIRSIGFSSCLPTIYEYNPPLHMK